MEFGFLTLGKKMYLPDESWPEVFVYFLQPFFVLSSLNIVLISALNPQKCYTVGGVRGH